MEKQSDICYRDIGNIASFCYKKQINFVSDMIYSIGLCSCLISSSNIIFVISAAENCFFHGIGFLSWKKSVIFCSILILK